MQYKHSGLYIDGGNVRNSDGRTALQIIQSSDRGDGSKFRIEYAGEKIWAKSGQASNNSRTSVGPGGQPLSSGTPTGSPPVIVYSREGFQGNLQELQDGNYVLPKGVRNALRASKRSIFAISGHC